MILLLFPEFSLPLPAIEIVCSSCHLPWYSYIEIWINGRITFVYWTDDLGFKKFPNQNLNLVFSLAVVHKLERALLFDECILYGDMVENVQFYLL